MTKQIRKAISIAILVAFISTSVKSPAYAQVASVDQMPFMPKPGVMVHLSPEYTPAYLKGIVIHPENALKFDFIIYKGDKELTDSQKREEYTKLTKYFLASLAIPDDDQWVNLSPYEKDRIIKDDFGKTEMGRDLLAQDYLLKQITASLIYPEDNLGKKFWDRVYTQAQKQYGTTNIPVNTFNKVWILPDDALIYEKGNTAYVLKNHLRVMLEEDYLSLQKHSGITSTVIPGTSTVIPAPAALLRKAKLQGGIHNKNNINTIASKIIKEIVLPELQREVNEDKNFAPLRQVYSGMLLATWFKRTLKQSLLGQIYANKAKVKGVDQDPKTNEEIYRQYLAAYKKGVFNFIKEDTNKLTNETIPRKYFSGGIIEGYDGRNKFFPNGIPITRELDTAQSATLGKEEPEEDVADFAMIEANAGKKKSDAAMRSQSAIQRNIDEIDKLLYGTDVAKTDGDTEAKLKARRVELQKELEEAKWKEGERLIDELVVAYSADFKEYIWGPHLSLAGFSHIVGNWLNAIQNQYQIAKMDDQMLEFNHDQLNLFLPSVKQILERFSDYSKADQLQAWADGFLANYIPNQSDKSLGNQHTLALFIKGGGFSQQFADAVNKFKHTFESTYPRLQEIIDYFAKRDKAMTANEALSNITSAVEVIKQDYDKERRQNEQESKDRLARGYSVPLTPVETPIIKVTYNKKLILNIPVDELSADELNNAFRQEHFSDDHRVRMTKSGNSFSITDAAMISLEEIKRALTAAGLWGRDWNDLRSNRGRFEELILEKKEANFSKIRAWINDQKQNLEQMKYLVEGDLAIDYVEHFRSDERIQRQWESDPGKLPKVVKAVFFSLIRELLSQSADYLRGEKVVLYKLMRADEHTITMRGRNARNEDIVVIYNKQDRTRLIYSLSEYEQEQSQKPVAEPESAKTAEPQQEQPIGPETGPVKIAEAEDSIKTIVEDELKGKNLETLSGSQWQHIAEQIYEDMLILHGEGMATGLFLGVLKLYLNTEGLRSYVERFLTNEGSQQRPLTVNDLVFIVENLHTFSLSLQDFDVRPEVLHFLPLDWVLLRVGGSYKFYRDILLENKWIGAAWETAEVDQPAVTELKSKAPKLLYLQSVGQLKAFTKVYGINDVPDFYIGMYRRIMNFYHNEIKQSIIENGQISNDLRRKITEHFYAYSVNNFNVVTFLRTLRDDYLFEGFKTGTTFGGILTGVYDPLNSQRNVQWRAALEKKEPGEVSSVAFQTALGGPTLVQDRREPSPRIISYDDVSADFAKYTEEVSKALMAIQTEQSKRKDVESPLPLAVISAYYALPERIKIQQEEIDKIKPGLYARLSGLRSFRPVKGEAFGRIDNIDQFINNVRQDFRKDPGTRDAILEFVNPHIEAQKTMVFTATPNIEDGQRLVNMISQAALPDYRRSLQWVADFMKMVGLFYKNRFALTDTNPFNFYYDGPQMKLSRVLSLHKLTPTVDKDLTYKRFAIIDALYMFFKVSFNFRQLDVNWGAVRALAENDFQGADLTLVNDLIDFLEKEYKSEGTLGEFIEHWNDKIKSINFAMASRSNFNSVHGQYSDILSRDIRLNAGQFTSIVGFYNNNFAQFQLLPEGVRDTIVRNLINKAKNGFLGTLRTEDGGFSALIIDNGTAGNRAMITKQIGLQSGNGRDAAMNGRKEKELVFYSYRTPHDIDKLKELPKRTLIRIQWLKGITFGALEISKGRLPGLDFVNTPEDRAVRLAWTGVVETSSVLPNRHRFAIKVKSMDGRIEETLLNLGLISNISPVKTFTLTSNLGSEQREQIDLELAKTRNFKEQLNSKIDQIENGMGFLDRVSVPEKLTNKQIAQINQLHRGTKSKSITIIVVGGSLNIYSHDAAMDAVVLKKDDIDAIIAALEKDTEISQYFSRLSKEINKSNAWENIRAFLEERKIGNQLVQDEDGLIAFLEGLEYAQLRQKRGGISYAQKIVNKTVQLRDEQKQKTFSQGKTALDKIILNIYYRIVWQDDQGVGHTSEGIALQKTETEVEIQYIGQGRVRGQPERIKGSNIKSIDERIIGSLGVPRNSWKNIFRRDFAMNTTMAPENEEFKIVKDGWRELLKISKHEDSSSAISDLNKLRMPRNPADWILPLDEFARKYEGIDGISQILSYAVQGHFMGRGFDLKGFLDRIEKPEDKAMTRGGIDLNSANLAMVIKRDGHGIPLPLAQQDLVQLSNIEGLDPVILSIKPASQTALFSQVVGQP